MNRGIVFPGQGSQSVGMLAQLPEWTLPIQIHWTELASNALGLDIGNLMANGPEDQLNQTAITQPVLLTANQILWASWQESTGGQQPHAAAGHSLGEFSALVAAGSLDFTDAVRLVAKRGQLMQEAVPVATGAMAAILGLPDDVVEAICREVAEDEVVSPANYNSPGQLVIAGHAPAVERAMLQAKAAGAKRAVVLPVSVPSHCALMQGAADQFKLALEDISIGAPRFPVVHNVDARTRERTEDIKAALVDQLAQPVQWTATIKALVQLGCGQLDEVGPGRVLTGLGRRIDSAVAWVSFHQELCK